MYVELIHVYLITYGNHVPGERELLHASISIWCEGHNHVHASLIFKPPSQLDSVNVRSFSYLLILTLFDVAGHGNVTLGI